MDPRCDGELGLVLGGGGARGAYQVGVLRGLARRCPDLRMPILTGVSAGGINTAHLACHTGSFVERAEALVKLWEDLSVEEVFRVDGSSLVSHVTRWASQLLLPFGRSTTRHLRGLVDTAPLRRFLANALNAREGELPGIEENLARGVLRAVALVTTRYDTGQTVSWCHGRDLTTWQRPQRVAVEARLTLEHVMASSALPLFFPAVRIGDAWYGDGGVRMHSPLAPAVHLGATRILGISTRYGRSRAEADRPMVDGYPPPAQVLGVLLNAIFLDLFDQDAANLERLNALLERLPEKQHGELRHIEFFLMRPSVDLGKLANEYEPRLPGLFRFLTRRLGTKETKAQDLISLVMFQPDYLRALIEIGERDVDARAAELEAFFEAEATRDRVPSAP